MRISHAPPHPSEATGRAKRPASPTLQRLVPASSRRDRLPRWLRRTTGPVALLALWQTLSSARVLAPDVLAPRAG